MKQYQLILKNDKQRSYRRFSIFLLAINFISIVFITYLEGFTKWGPLILSLIAAFSVFSSFYFKNKNERISFGVAFLFFSLSWQTADYWLGAGLNLIFLILNEMASLPPVSTVDETQIKFPSFPKKTISWKELNNIVLKDGLLTIDLKNNRLIQQLLDDASSSIDEKEFNEFCKQQLNK
jgi:hypothetical protein